MEESSLDFGNLNASIALAREVPPTSAPNLPDMPTDYDITKAQDAHTENVRNHPALVGKYEITRKLGEGAQGEMWLARQISTNSYVAIKSLSFDSLTSWKSSELFIREIETLKSMHITGTPQYIEAIDASQCDQPYFFLVQTLIPGQTLDKLLEDGHRFTPEDIAAIALSILPILAELRTYVPPIVHRDIKPSNIMCTPDGEIYLIDFGASMLHEKSMGGTTVAGTAGYMAPEQCIGASGPESDIYSLGATLVHLLSGKPPWQMTLTTNMNLLFKQYLPLDTPPILTQLLESMLDPIPEKRLNNLPKLVSLLHDNGLDKGSERFSIQRAKSLIKESTLNSLRPIDKALAAPPSKQQVERKITIFPKPAFKGIWVYHVAAALTLIYLVIKAIEIGRYSSGFIIVCSIIMVLIDFAIMFALTYIQSKYFYNKHQQERLNSSQE